MHAGVTLCFISGIGRMEGHGESWHGHVSALTVAPENRRLGIADRLMYLLESYSEK